MDIRQRDITLRLVAERKRRGADKCAAERAKLETRNDFHRQLVKVEGAVSGLIF